MPTYFLKGEIVGEFSSRNFYQKIFHQDGSSLTLTIVLHLFLFPHQDKKKRRKLRAVYDFEAAN